MISHRIVFINVISVGFSRPVGMGKFSILKCLNYAHIRFPFRILKNKPLLLDKKIEEKMIV